MEENINKLYEIHNIYSNISYDTTCLLSLLEKIYFEAEQNGKNELNETVHSIRTLVMDIDNKIKVNNELFDRTMILIHKIRMV